MATGSEKSPVPHHTLLSVEVLPIPGLVLTLQSSAIPTGFQDGASTTVPSRGMDSVPLCDDRDRSCQKIRQHQVFFKGISIFLSFRTEYQWVKIGEHCASDKRSSSKGANCLLSPERIQIPNRLWGLLGSSSRTTWKHLDAPGKPRTCCAKDLTCQEPFCFRKTSSLYLVNLTESIFDLTNFSSPM